MRPHVLSSGRPPEPCLGEVAPRDGRRLSGAGARGGEREARVVAGGPVGGRVADRFEGHVEVAVGHREVLYRGPLRTSSEGARALEQTGPVGRLPSAGHRAHATRRCDQVV